jgi:hypothetical protein
MSEIIELRRFRELKESLPKFTDEYQKTMLLGLLQEIKKVGYENLGFIFCELSKKDFRFGHREYFTEEMKNKLLFSLAMKDKIQLRTKNGMQQIKLYSKSACKVLKLQLARFKADNIWNM